MPRRNDDCLPGGAAGAAPACRRATEFTVSIKTAGEKKLNVIKEVRAITSLGLKEAKDLVEAGGVVKEGIAKEEATRFAASSRLQAQPSKSNRASEHRDARGWVAWPTLYLF